MTEHEDNGLRRRDSDKCCAVHDVWVEIIRENKEDVKIIKNRVLTTLVGVLVLLATSWFGLIFYIVTTNAK
jgi:hypothetical protein